MSFHWWDDSITAYYYYINRIYHRCTAGDVCSSRITKETGRSDTVRSWKVHLHTQRRVHPGNNVSSFKLRKISYLLLTVLDHSTLQDVGTEKVGQHLKVQIISLTVFHSVMSTAHCKYSMMCDCNKWKISIWNLGYLRVYRVLNYYLYKMRNLSICCLRRNIWAAPSSLALYYFG